MWQGILMSTFGGLLVGMGIMLLSGGVKAYLSVMTMPEKPALSASGGGQWRVPTAEEAQRLNIPLTQNN